MLVTTGLTNPTHFAAHGFDVFHALNDAAPKPLPEFSDVLDFGVGVGRLARLFKGFRGTYTGVDVDAHNIAWVNRALSHVKAILTQPRKALPLPDAAYDLIISVSVFSHMNEADHLFYLSELARVAKPGATLLLSTHGERALTRGVSDESVFNVLQVSRQRVLNAHAAFDRRGFQFIRQWRGHLNNLFYAYGITFISASYIRDVWSRYFDVVDIRSGAIHDFQDIVVLKARAR
jgi:SAM-dependent methyltransferase